MKHQTPEDLKRDAVVLPRVMTRNERLARWAELLEREPGRCLSSLPGTEYQPVETRRAMRSTGSPIAVALEDPILRAQGLGDDSYGEAKRFFEITDWQLHGIVCYCHHGATMTAGTAARHVRAAIDGPGPQGLFARVRDVIVG
jgi:hypothetical protein